LDFDDCANYFGYGEKKLPGKAKGVNLIRVHLPITCSRALGKFRINFEV
jgi:hypothetical protein